MNNKINIICSLEIETTIHESVTEIFKSSGDEFNFITPDKFHDKNDYSCKSIAFLSADILGNSTKTELSEEMVNFCNYLDKQENLYFIQVPGAGVDRDAYKKWFLKGSHICNASGVASKVVAQSAIAGILAISRGFPKLFKAQESKEWISFREGKALEPIYGKNAFIIGTGNIGKEINNLCQALGMNTYGFNRTGKCLDGGFDYVFGISDIKSKIMLADWVILCCPLNSETENLIEEKLFSLMKSGVNIVNVSRGQVIEEDALIKNIYNGKVANAYLDVFQVEPLPKKSPLWSFDNVIVSPHSAGDYLGRNNDISKIFLKNISNMLHDKKLINDSIL